MDFGNQTVIVTGGTGALGRAVVGALDGTGQLLDVGFDVSRGRRPEFALGCRRCCGKRSGERVAQFHRKFARASAPLVRRQEGHP
jgi:NAD(P)-dependent dehydrogenase (short-subunit alcohol dehydrogenase family)